MPSAIFDVGAIDDSSVDASGTSARGDEAAVGKNGLGFWSFVYTCAVMQRWNPRYLGSSCSVG